LPLVAVRHRPLRPEQKKKEKRIREIARLLSESAERQVAASVRLPEDLRA